MQYLFSRIEFVDSTMRAPQVKKEPSGGTRRQSITIEKRIAEEGTRTPKDLSRFGTFPAAIPVQSASFAVNGRNGWWLRTSINWSATGLRIGYAHPGPSPGVSLPDRAFVPGAGAIAGQSMCRFRQAKESTEWSHAPD